MNRKKAGNFVSNKKCIYFVPINFKIMIRFIIIGLLVFIVACSPKGGNNVSQNEEINYDTINGPYLYFYSDTQDLGTVKQGDKVNCTFKLKNAGKSDLVIFAVTAGCGCTNTEWEPKPIKPGNESEIKIVFNSAGRKGKQSKTVFVRSNASDKEKALKFSCEVVIPN
jgi:hypothetical protein